MPDYINLYKAFEQLEKERLEYIGYNEEGACGLPLLDAFSERVRKNVSDFREETVKRIQADAAEIADSFFDGERFCEIRAVSHSGADFHAHGRCVLRIETDKGIFYYKPRVSDMDSLFCRIADRWFSDVTKAPRIICREGYSYASLVEPKEVEAEEEVGQFYRNLGVLLALFKAIGSSDMHGGNIIAAGSFPVVIDMETMLVPVASKSLAFPTSLWFPQDDDLTFSVYSTVVLPSNQIGFLQLSPLYRAYSNTDCLPVLKGFQFPVTGYEGELIRGFEEGYKRILFIKDDLIGLLDENSDTAFRYVLRPTSYYERMLRELLKREALEDKEKQEEIFIRLGNRFRKSGVRETKRLMEWEQAALLEADFPYYQTRLDGKDLYGNMHQEPIIKDSFSLSALEHAKKRLDSMDEDELRFEKRLIETSLRQPFVSYTWWEKRPDALRAEEAGRVMPEAEADKLLSGKRLVIETGGIVSDIESLMVTTPQGRHLWCGGNKSILRTSGLPFIESGYAGLALFFRKYILCAEGKAEEETVRQARRLLDICREEISVYKKGWEAELETSERKYSDMQYQGMERLHLAERALDGDQDAEEELEEMIFGSFNETGTAELSGLQTDIVSDGRAGAAGQRLFHYRKTRDAKYLAEAKLLIAGIIADRETSGAYITRKPSFHNSADPSFYFGESGIGYVMLMMFHYGTSD